MPVRTLPLMTMAPEVLLYPCLPVGDRGLPDDFAGAGIERVQAGIGGGQQQLVVVNRQRARGAVAAGGFGTDAILPDQVAGAAIKRLEGVAGVGEINNSVVDDGRRLVGAAVVHRPNPGQLQTASRFRQ